MKIVKSIFTIIILCFTNFSFYQSQDISQNFGNDQNVFFVNAKGGLRMRIEPSTNSKTILNIPDKSKVISIEEHGETINISNTNGKWTKIKYKENEGWVFGGFLNKEDNSNKKSNDVQIPIPSKLIGDYKSFENSCASGWASDLYISDKVVICADGETGMVPIACLPTQIDIEGDNFILNCSDIKKYQIFENLFDTKSKSIFINELTKFPNKIEITFEKTGKVKTRCQWNEPYTYLNIKAFKKAKKCDN
ncbi:SH3 domain-containing protein [Leptospira vanthielii]|uniref:SH3 domain protein n=1 Tax=Leptospira vanthielii serovar Holland str. Waz Holland = ATCC 700522 TaxID=1218591 RepID=N1W3J7_9LEPT|nr:SH3 domain-containing protein [Leptospira vanthielii]EMY67807.1 SH3 domain protein [Leptospira vanthielii serovar Holland str. Waz Holland = ATCC 700522]